jgi:hypothetical protein
VKKRTGKKDRGRKFPFPPRIKTTLLLLAAGAAFAAISLLQMAPPEPRRGAAVPRPGQKPPGSVEQPPAPPALPRVAILIDDIGLKKQPVKTLMELDIPLTFAVLPGQRYSTELARTIHDAGHEVILHIPMEPQDKEWHNPGTGALMVSHTEEEVREMVRKMIGQMPHLSGVNNHMGSLFTKDFSKMRIVLDEVKNAGLYFVDSVTTPDSVALGLAREIGLKSSGRRVFLDNERDTELIKAAIRRTIKIARERGQAVAICHPYPETIAALSDMKPEFTDAGVELVFASGVVR